MIYFQNNIDIPKAVSFSYQETTRFFSDTREKVSQIAQNHPVLTGIVAGVGQVLFFSQLSQCLYHYFPSIFEIASDEGMAKDYLEYILKNPFDVIVAAPILEELLFRGGLQTLVHFAVERAMTFCGIDADKEVDIVICKIKRAALISVFATSLIFGYCHLANGLGIGQVIFSTMGGISFGLLKETLGLQASMVSHMTNNACIWLALNYSNN